MTITEKMQERKKARKFCLRTNRALIEAGQIYHERREMEGERKFLICPSRVSPLSEWGYLYGFMTYEQRWETV